MDHREHREEHRKSSQVTEGEKTGLNAPVSLFSVDSGHPEAGPAVARGKRAQKVVAGTGLRDPLLGADDTEK